MFQSFDMRVLTLTRERPCHIVGFAQKVRSIPLINVLQ